MSATLKKLDDIQKRKQALEQEEAHVRSEFITAFTEILASLPLFQVEFDILIGAIATTIDQARHDNPSSKNDPQVKLWKERGLTELHRFRRLKKNVKLEQKTSSSSTQKSTTAFQKDHPMEKTATKNEEACPF